jgi:hypothetical protein
VGSNALYAGGGHRPMEGGPVGGVRLGRSAFRQSLPWNSTVTRVAVGFGCRTLASTGAKSLVERTLRCIVLNVWTGINYSGRLPNSYPSV